MSHGEMLITYDTCPPPSDMYACPHLATARLCWLVGPHPSAFASAPISRKRAGLRQLTWSDPRKSFFTNEFAWYPSVGPDSLRSWSADSPTDRSKKRSRRRPTSLVTQTDLSHMELDGGSRWFPIVMKLTRIRQVLVRLGQRICVLDHRSSKELFASQHTMRISRISWTSVSQHRPSTSTTTSDYLVSSRAIRR